MIRWLTFFRWIARAEGISLLSFAVTMPLKYQLLIFWLNQVVGMIHGLLFLLYIITLCWITFKFNWHFMDFCFAFIASFLPFGTFTMERYYLRDKDH
jgi:integral membrane protein